MVKTAMVLAAGRGERLRPLTDRCPKPLLKIAGKPLLQYHLEALAKVDITQIVVNHAWLGEQIIDTIGSGKQFGVSIQYSKEQEALETGGGVFKALPLLGEEPFLVINGDIWTNMDLSDLKLPKGKLAHLIMVNNPEQHPEGDFHLSHGEIDQFNLPKLTFSGIGIYHPDLFKDCTGGRFSLADLLRKVMPEHCVSGELFQGHWFDVGTPERLNELEQKMLNGEIFL